MISKLRKNVNMSFNAARFLLYTLIKLLHEEASKKLFEILFG